MWSVLGPAQRPGSPFARGRRSTRLGANEFDATAKPVAQNVPPEFDAGPDQVTTLTNPRAASATTNGPTSRSRSLGKRGSRWCRFEFAAGTSAETTATFSVPGTYLLQLIADDGDLSAGDLDVVFVYPELPQRGRPIRIEAEHMLLEFHAVKEAPFASGGKYGIRTRP